MLKSNNCEIKEKNGVMYITFPILEKSGFVKACFSTRMGGVSRGRYSSMNLSYTNGDDAAAVDENFRRICECIDVNTDSVVKSHQTHTVNVLNVTEKGQTVPPDTDGLITNVRGVTLCSSFADCVPLLFFDPVKRVIASSHSGWRGTVNEMGAVTVKKLQSDYGCKPEDLICVVGPAICKDCYEVDDKVITEINKLEYLENVYDAKPQGKYQLDLKEACRQILIHSGVKDKNILVSDICTCCNSEYLHSHRATGGNRGNLCSFISLI